MALDIPSNELPVAPHAALQVDKVVGVADGADTLGDLLALFAEALVLVASGFHVLLHLLQARGYFWRAARARLCRFASGGVEGRLHPVACLFRLHNDRCGSPLFGGQWG